jgi:hypothetical protein
MKYPALLQQTAERRRVLPKEAAIFVLSGVGGSYFLFFFVVSLLLLFQYQFTHLKKRLATSKSVRTSRTTDLKDQSRCSSAILKI